jgi:hypothetical protein
VRASRGLAASFSYAGTIRIRFEGFPHLPAAIVKAVAGILAVSAPCGAPPGLTSMVRHAGSKVKVTIALWQTPATV